MKNNSIDFVQMPFSEFKDKYPAIAEEISSSSPFDLNEYIIRYYLDNSSIQAVRIDYYSEHGDRSFRRKRSCKKKAVL